MSLIPLPLSSLTIILLVSLQILNFQLYLLFESGIPHKSTVFDEKDDVGDGQNRKQHAERKVVQKPVFPGDGACHGIANVEPDGKHAVHKCQSCSSGLWMRNIRNVGVTGHEKHRAAAGQV